MTMLADIHRLRIQQGRSRSNSRGSIMTHRYYRLVALPARRHRQMLAADLWIVAFPVALSATPVGRAASGSESWTFADRGGVKVSRCAAGLPERVDIHS